MRCSVGPTVASAFTSPRGSVTVTRASERMTAFLSITQHIHGAGLSIPGVTCIFSGFGGAPSDCLWAQKVARGGGVWRWGWGRACGWIRPANPLPFRPGFAYNSFGCNPKKNPPKRRSRSLTCIMIKETGAKWVWPSQQCPRGRGDEGLGRARAPSHRSLTVIFTRRMADCALWSLAPAATHR